MNRITTDALNKYNYDKLNRVKLFAFMPTGILGVHDFMIGRNMQGILHIIISFSAFLFYNGLGEIICKGVGNCRNVNEINTFYSSLLVLGVLSLIGSWIWAAIEGDTISRIIKERYKPRQEPLETIEEACETTEPKIEIQKVTALSPGEVFSAIYITITIPIILFCLFAVLVDGWCSGGYFCSRPPGLKALGAAAAISIIITSYIYLVKKANKKVLKWRYLILIPVLTATIYFIRLGDPSELWRLNPPRIEVVRTGSVVEYEHRDIEVKNQWFKVRVNFDTKELYVHSKNGLGGENEYGTMLTDDELYKINKIINSTYLDGEKYSHFKALSLALEEIARDKESRDLDKIMVWDKNVICRDDEYCQRIVQTLSQKLYPQS